MVAAPARRELVRWLQTRGLSERRGLQVAGMSASALRYAPRPDRNPALRGRIVALAQRHRRYGVGMIYLKLRQAGELVNYKRVERLYRLEKLHIRRRRRKKIPVAERQPLVRPGQANEIWSMDFVFDRIATGRTLKCLTIVDDATHEAIAVVPEHTIGGDHLTRILDAVCAQRGRPLMIRSGNGPEFTGRLRDECLNEHWFTSLAHAQALIEAWRREYNEERPKKSLGGLTPAAYAKQLAARPLHGRTALMPSATEGGGRRWQLL